MSHSICEQGNHVPGKPYMDVYGEFKILCLRCGKFITKEIKKWAQIRDAHNNVVTEYLPLREAIDKIPDLYNKNHRKLIILFSDVKPKLKKYGRRQ